MQVLREIIKRSKYKPSGGLKGELYHLINEKKYDLGKIKEHFHETGKIKQFYSVNRHLKESLLESLLTTSLYTLSKALRNRIKLLKKQLQTRILLYTGSKIAGIKLAIDTISVAEKSQDFETVHALCRELLIQFSVGKPDAHKYRKYRKKMDKAWQDMEEELLGERVYRDLLYYHNTKESIAQFQKKIRQLDNIANSNKNHKFNYFYFSVKSLFFQLNKDNEQLYENNKTAYNFFEQINQDLHFAPKLAFLSELIPYFILEKKFGQAETTIQTCLTIPPVGSYNWHRILIFKTILGFYSKKPKISLNAYKLSKSYSKKFSNHVISEKWHIVHGYLVIYHKFRQIHYDSNFKLRKFLNIAEQQKNKALKSNLLILELLHLLTEGRRMLFFEKLEKIESYISSSFRAHSFKRTRYFLRLLKSVVKGNYHVPLIKAHAKKQWKNLEESRKDIDIDTLDIEIVPYEFLWDMVLGFLRK